MRNARIPEVPSDMPRHWRDFFQKMREAAVQPQGQQPDDPTQVKVTGTALANIIQFTMPLRVESIVLWWNSVPQFQGATPVELGLSAQYTDYIGKDGVKRYYWLRSKKGGANGNLVGPFNATTLTAAAGVAYPTPPPAGPISTVDSSLGVKVPGSIEQRENIL